MGEKIVNHKYFPWGCGFVGGVLFTKLYEWVTDSGSSCQSLPEGKKDKKKKKNKHKHEED